MSARLRRLVALALVTLCVSGCLRWERVPLAAVQRGDVDLHTRTVHLASTTDEATLRVDRVEGTVVEGWDETRRAERRIDLTRARSIRVRETDALGSGLLVGAVYLAVSVVSWLAIVRDAF